MIRLNYAALRKDKKEAVQINDELLKKAKKTLGFAARKELVALFADDLRLQAMEVAQRQMNPQLLVDAGEKGILDALKVYEVGRTRQQFREFALPFIKHSMQSAKSKAGK